MAALEFTLSPSAAALLHGALLCLSRFNDTVSFDSREENLTLSTLNLSNTAHAAVKLGKAFFINYSFTPTASTINESLSFSVAIKAILPIFRQRAHSHGVIKYEVSVGEGDDATTCRLVTRIICTHGLIKTFSLTYEAVEINHPLFDRQNSPNRWTIKSSFLRQNVDFFGPRVEQLDIFYEQNKVTFISFTQKVTAANKEVLKQPLKTTVTLNAGDFTNFKVQEALHVVISVKDFKAIVTHAESLNASVSAIYSSAGRPLQFTYEKEAMACQFTLMTAGENRAVTKASNQVQVSNRNPTPVQRSITESRASEPASRVLAPPARTDIRRNTKTLGKRNTTITPTAPSSSRVGESETLFVTQDEDDEETWDPPNYEDTGESLGWDVGESGGSIFQRAENTTSRVTATENDQQIPQSTAFAPTQRLSDIPKLW